MSITSLFPRARAAGSDERPRGLAEGAVPLRLVAAWLLGVYLAFLYIRAGWGKFDSEGFWAVSFAHWGYSPWLRILVGVIEVVAGAALVVPWVASYGALALCAVMIAAGSTLAGDHRWTDVGRVTAYAAGLVWISYQWWWLRLDRHLLREPLSGHRENGDPASAHVRDQ